MTTDCICGCGVGYEIWAAMRSRRLRHGNNYGYFSDSHVVVRSSAAAALIGKLFGLVLALEMEDVESRFRCNPGVRQNEIASQQGNSESEHSSSQRQETRRGRGTLE